MSRPLHCSHDEPASLVDLGYVALEMGSELNCYTSLRSVRLVSSFGELNEEWVLPAAAGRKIHIVTATLSKVFFSLIIFHVLEMPSLKKGGAIHTPMFTFHILVNSCSLIISNLFDSMAEI